MRIEERAHELWLARGSHEDIALKNWLNAEQQVLEEFIQGYKRGRGDKRRQKRYGHSLPPSDERSDVQRTG